MGMIRVLDIIRNAKQIVSIYDELKHPKPVRQVDPFEVGDYVKKVSGDYHVRGFVIAVFFTRRRKRLYVVEIEAEGGGSFCHIYGQSNLELVLDSKAPSTVKLQLTPETEAELKEKFGDVRFIPIETI